jgi:hypothetical protein
LSSLTPSETDPVFTASAASGITLTNISNWNTAYGWGDHASVGYLTSFTESDPTVPSHVKSITTTKISNWDTAYGWGNHASAGYLTSLPSSATFSGTVSANSTRGAEFRGTANVGGTGEATWHPAGIYSGSTQWLYGTTYRNSSDTRGQGNMYFDSNYGYGMIGLYNSTRYQGVFAMGDAYKLPVDGTSPSNLYGITWSHPNAGGVAGNLNTHGALILENGTFLAALSGSIRSRDDMRSPVFYDSNNTGYYLNPDGFSNLHSATFNANWAGGSPHHGAINIRGNYPSMMFRNFVSNTAWLRHMDGAGDIQHYYVPDGYDSANWTIKHTMTGGGMFYSAESHRAPIFYDSNNTGYYTDPASTSVLNNITFGTSTNGGNLSGNSDWGMRFTTSSGYIWFGPANSGHAHIYTDRPNFYFNAQLTVNGGSQINTSDIRASIFYDSDNTNYYLNPAGTYSQIYADGSVNGSAGVGLSFWSNGGNGAIFSFHRGGVYAVNMGLDSDNVIRIGGWSAAGSRLQMDMSGNLTMAGDVTAYSDARVKENVKTINNALEKVLKSRGVYYNRTDSEDKKTKIGVIAQEMLEVVPEVVNQDNDGMYNVSYGNITALLIEAIKEQNQIIEDLKQRITKLEA